MKKEKMKITKFPGYVYVRLLKCLPLQRGLSKNTISSYNYTLMLFYGYCKTIRHIRQDELTFAKINKALVEDFCMWLETEGHNSASTRN